MDSPQGPLEGLTCRSGSPCLSDASYPAVIVRQRSACCSTSDHTPDLSPLPRSGSAALSMDNLLSLLHGIPASSQSSSSSSSPGSRVTPPMVSAGNAVVPPVTLFDCCSLYGISLRCAPGLDEIKNEVKRSMDQCSGQPTESGTTCCIHLHSNYLSPSPKPNSLSYRGKRRGRKNDFRERPLSHSPREDSRIAPLFRTCYCDRCSVPAQLNLADIRTVSLPSRISADQDSASVPASSPRFCLPEEDFVNDDAKPVLLSDTQTHSNLGEINAAISALLAKSHLASGPTLSPEQHYQDGRTQETGSCCPYDNASPCSMPLLLPLPLLSAPCDQCYLGTSSLDLNLLPWDELSADILQHYLRNRQSETLLRTKLKLRDILQKEVASVFPTSGLYIVGSSLNGFGGCKSDMDMCLMLTSKEIDQRTDAVRILMLLSAAFSKNEIIHSQRLIEAKVPILRLDFDPPFEGISVDLNVNNSVGIRNTHLLYYYSNWDWRVKPLVFAIKEWARWQGINDASQSTLSSYSLVLMSLHYLQCGASPSVLPSLQKLYPHRFHYRIDVRFLNMREALHPSPSSVFTTFNTQSLGELLLGFLEYYAFQFNFEDHAISVRCGTKIPRCSPTGNVSAFGRVSQWKCLCIEEPFTLSNTAHSVYDERIFNKVKRAFVSSYECLRFHKRMSCLTHPLITDD